MYFSTATCGSESWSIITVGLIMMYHLRRFKVVRESVDMLKPRAAVAVAVVHGDDDLREDLLRQPPRFLRGKSGAAAGGYHQRVRAEYAPDLAAVELGADVSHISTPGIYSHATVSGGLLLASASSSCRLTVGMGAPLLRRCRRIFNGIGAFLIAVHDCRGHGKKTDCHADDTANDSCDSFPNAVSLPRRDSGTV